MCVFARPKIGLAQLYILETRTSAWKSWFPSEEVLTLCDFVYWCQSYETKVDNSLERLVV